jgi:hypothetical protein
VNETGEVDIDNRYMQRAAAEASQMDVPESAEMERLREDLDEAQKATYYQAAELQELRRDAADANRALDAERAAHRVTAARQERFGAALTEVVHALVELPGEAGMRVALRAARQALADG